jgi:uncharacterized protein with NRDE domain
MCLAVIAIGAHRRYWVIVAANRDEFHARRSARAHWWTSANGVELLGGRDLEHGGTWLGVDRQGRFAFVTNVREPGRMDAQAPSRGALVPDVLRDGGDIGAAVKATVDRSRGYNGFNLIAGDRAQAWFASNRAPQPRRLPAGITGLSNAQLDTPWPKVARAKRGMAEWIANGGDDLHVLFDVLADTSRAGDDELPDTGIPRERESLLSSPFIVSAAYGTRCSTIVALTADGDAFFIERSYDANGARTGDVDDRFRTLRASSHGSTAAGTAA